MPVAGLHPKIAGKSARSTPARRVHPTLVAAVAPVQGQEYIGIASTAQANPISEVHGG